MKRTLLFVCLIYGSSYAANPATIVSANSSQSGGSGRVIKNPLTLGSFFAGSTQGTVDLIRWFKNYVSSVTNKGYSDLSYSASTSFSPGASLNVTADLSDSKLDSYKSNWFATYDPLSGKIVDGIGYQARKSKKYGDDSVKALAAHFTDGVFNINSGALVQGIGQGMFKDILTARVILQEVLMGRLAVSANAISKIKIFDTDGTKIVQDFSKAAADTFRQSRYFSSGLKTKSLTPIDFFVGCIVINNSVAAINSNGMMIHPSNSGFIPSQEPLNAWNIQSMSLAGYPIRKQSFYLQNISNPVTIKAVTFNQANYSGVQITDMYGKNLVASNAKFFSELHPWAVVISISNQQSKNSPGNLDIKFETQALVKLNALDFGDQIKVVGTATNKDATIANFNLSSLINAPYKLYQKSYSTSKIVQAKSALYPLAYSFTQALYNGYLEASFFRPYFGKLPSSFKLVDDLRNPLQHQVFAKNSGIDYKNLQVLRITKAALAQSHLTKSGLQQMSRIVANPQATLKDSSGKVVYVGATDKYIPFTALKVS